MTIINSVNKFCKIPIIPGAPENVPERIQLYANFMAIAKLSTFLTTILAIYTKQISEYPISFHKFFPCPKSLPCILCYGDGDAILSWPKKVYFIRFVYNEIFKEREIFI